MDQTKKDARILNDIMHTMMQGGIINKESPLKQVEITPQKDYSIPLSAYQSFLYPTYTDPSLYSDNVWKAKEDFTHLADKRFIPMPGWCIPGILGYTQVGADWMVINTDAYPDTIASTQLHEIRHRRSEYVTRMIEHDIQLIKKPKYFK